MRYSIPMSSHRTHAILAAVALLVGACGGPAESGSPSPSTAPTSESSAAATSPTSRACPAEPAPVPATTTRWWHDRVFYEIFVRSFADSDGDGIGDLQGLISRLDSLNDGDPSTTDDLGVTALWLMPIDASPSYHGYDVTDYRTVEPDYGTNDDFRALVSAARERGIEIIVDLVMNHTSIDHPWFQDARSPGSVHDDWYLWADEHPGIGGPGGRPVWHADGERWYYGYFWEGMPDLNLGNDEVTAEMDAAARFWVDEMGAAGFRLDAARHLIEDGATLENTPETFAWLRGFKDRLQAPTPDALVLGEVWDAASVASRYVREGSLDLAFDFGLASQMLQAVRNGDATSLGFIQSEVSAVYPTGGYAAFLSNHDQDRVFDAVGGDPARARQAATLLLTNPGVPFIYYGEEVGLRGRKPDERIRTPMPWDMTPPGYGFTTGEPWQPMAEGIDTANVAGQSGDADSLLSHYRDLIRLRAGEPALGPGGTLTPVQASDRSVYAVIRDDPGSGVIAVISNLSDEPVEDVVLSLDTGPLCGTPTAAVRLGDPGVPVAAPLVNPLGGFVTWDIGPMAAHQDLVIALEP
jgi:alpha-amylase